MKIFTYKRGEDWSVNCILTGLGGESITYFGVVTPKGATNTLKEKFLEEAETAVLKQVSLEQTRRTGDKV